jgi:hypothetical protein
MDERLQRYRDAREKRQLGYFEELYGEDVIVAFVRDINTREIFKCWCKAKDPWKSNELRTQIAKMNRKIKQSFTDRGIEMIAESSGDLGVIMEYGKDEDYDEGSGGIIV